MPETLRSRLILIVLLGALLFGGLFVYITNLQSPEERVFAQTVAELSHKKEREYHTYFFEHIDILYRAEGINGMIKRVSNDVRAGNISMFVCHSIAHDIGHYGGYPEIYEHRSEFLSKENLDFCGSGFQHGIEGQLANEPYPQNLEKLYEFCKLSMPYEPYYGACYHGAGHAFMENERVIEKALAQCDLLITDEDVDVKSCYRGVFSERVDLEYKTTDGPKPLLEFCSTQEEHLQEYCALELHGLGIAHNSSQEEINAAFRECLKTAYSEVLQVGCVRSVASTVVDHTLGMGENIMPHEAVFAYPERFRREYIVSTYETYRKTASLTDRFSLVPFCNAFMGDDQTYCYEVITKSTEG